jgi:hypothetical protein
MALLPTAGWGGSPPGDQRCNLQPGRSEPSGERCSSRRRPSAVAEVELPEEGSGRLQNRLLTQPTVLLVLLDRDPGRLAAVNPGLGDPAPQRLLPTATCLETASTATVFGRVLGTVLQHLPDGSGPSSGSNFFGMTCIPSNSERMRHQTGKAPRGASTAPGCDPALGLGGRRARFRSGHIRRTGVELTRHPELFNHGSP